MRLRRPASAAAILLLLAAPVAAQPVRNLTGFRTNTLQANDDGSTGEISLSPLAASGLNFFGTTYSSLWVNNNGNVTFNGPLATFTPFGLTSSIGTPIIAAFFADVDTRGPSLNGSSDGGANDGNTPQPFDGSGLVTYGFDNVGGRAAFGVDWFSDCAAWTGAGTGPTCSGLLGDGYFEGRTQHLNVFQLMLIDRSDLAAGDFDIEYDYNTMTWNTGQASDGDANGRGGSSARVGFSNGTGATGSFFEFAGSGVDGAFLDGGPAATSLIRNSNVGVNGRYLITVRGGQVVVPPPSTTTPEPSTLALVGLGGMALGAAGGWRRRRARAT